MAIDSLPYLDKLPQSHKQVKTGTDNSIVDAIGKTVAKFSATYSDSNHSKHSKTLQFIAKQGGNREEKENPVLDSKKADNAAKNEI